jgi:hypothetical protein
VAFITDHLSDEFFEREADGQRRAVRYSEVKRVLKTAYALRSGYVHRLEGLRTQLHVPALAQGEVFTWNGEPFLTYRGLLRVALHVVKKFIAMQPKIAGEAYPYESELPGIVQMPLAAEYWVTRPPKRAVSLTAQQSTYRMRTHFEGFLREYVSSVGTSKPLPDMRPFLIWSRHVFDDLDILGKRRALALCLLFNATVRNGYQVARWEAFCDKHKNLWEEPSIEALLVVLLTKSKLPWPEADCLKAYETFDKQRFSRAGLDLPATLESALLGRLANAHLASGDAAAFSSIVRRAKDELAGHASIQGALARCVDTATPIDIESLLRSDQTEERGSSR